jgi:hypothetical protein
LLDTDGGTANWTGNTFISGGTGHAIYITAIGEYTFTSLTFTGYADQGGTDTNRSVYNNSGGSVTINNSGSTGISYRNGTSADTTVVDTITVTYTGIVNDTEIRVYETGTSTEKDGIESVTGGEFAASLQGSTGYDIVAVYPGYIPIRFENTSYTGSTTHDLNQQVDRNYENALATLAQGIASLYCGNQSWRNLGTALHRANRETSHGRSEHRSARHFRNSRQGRGARLDAYLHTPV